VLARLLRVQGEVEQCADDSINMSPSPCFSTLCSSCVVWSFFGFHKWLCHVITIIAAIVENIVLVDIGVVSPRTNHVIRFVQF
jgi:hypothetical protein